VKKYGQDNDKDRESSPAGTRFTLADGRSFRKLADFIPNVVSDTTWRVEFFNVDEVVEVLSEDLVEPIKNAEEVLAALEGIPWVAPENLSPGEMAEIAKLGNPWDI
jgi:hypothetical protein